VRGSSLWFVALVWFVAVGTVAASTVRFVTDNGLTVVMREDHAAPVLTMQAWVKTGSITEGHLQGSGMSHFVEHMLFKGTKRRAVGDYAREIASYGGTLNAYTTYDRTVYFFTIASSYFDEGLDAIADVIQNATFPADETVKEQEVIRREIAMTNDSPGHQMWQTVMESAFRVHPFRVPIIGYLPAYNRLTRDDLVAYYQKRYVPDNCVFVVAGDFDATAARPKVEAAFKDWQRRALAPVYYPTEPDQVAPRTVERPLAIQKTKCYLTWQGMSVASPDVFAADVLAIIAGQGKASRLHKRLVERDQLVEQVSSNNFTPTDRGLFMVTMQLDRDKLDRAVAAVEDEFARLKRDLVGAAELARARSLVVAAAVRGLETVEGVADALGSGEFEVGNPDFKDYYVERIRAVTAEDVREAARRYVVGPTLTKVVFTPKDDGAPKKAEGPKGRDLLAELRQRHAAKAGQSVDAAEDARHPRASVQQLSNGLKTVVLERHRLPLVAIAVNVRGGSRYEKGFAPGTAALMAEMLVKGTKSRSAEQIAETVEGVGGQLPVVASIDTYGLRAVVLKEHLDLAVDLVADILQHCTFPQDELTKAKRLQLAAVKTERDKPFRKAMLDFYAVRYGDHPWGRSHLGTEASVGAMTRDELVRYYEATCTPDNACLSVVGDVERADVVARLERKLASWRGRCRLPQPDAVPAVTGETVKHFAMPDWQQAFVLLGFAGAPLGHEDVFALDVLNDMVGGMGNRLFRTLRGKKSLAYQVGCSHETASDLRSQLFYIVTEPARVDEAVAGLRTEIAEALDAMPSEDQVARARNKAVGESAIDLQENRSLAATMAYHELVGLGWDFPFRRNDELAKVTAEQVRAVARTYWRLGDSLQVVVGPGPAK